MSTIKGNVKEGGLRISQTTIRCHLLDTDVVAAGSLINADKDVTERSDSLGQFQVVLAPGKWEIFVGGRGIWEINVPNDFLEYDIIDLLDPEFAPPDPPPASVVTDFDVNLRAWAVGGAFHMTNPLPDSDGLVTSSAGFWPDGSPGTYTLLQKDANFAFAVRYQITYDALGKIVTQPLITLNASGQPIIIPVLVIT